MAVCFEGFSEPWVVELVQDIDYLIVGLVVIQDTEDLEGEAALGLLAGPLNESHHLRMAAGRFMKAHRRAVSLSQTLLCL